MAIPTLPQVEAYDPQHLMSAAQHWDEKAQIWEDTLGEFHASAQGLDFLGRTAAATRASAARQHQDALALADRLRQAASIAGNACDELRQGKQRVLNKVQDAINNGFEVGPTYTVTDTRGSHASDSPARQVAAQEFSTDMIRYATALYEHDSLTASRMIQAVDFKTDGHIPDPPPGPVPPGKQWWYHEGTGWKLDDHLQPCSGDRVAGDVLSVAGALVPPVGLPGVLADLNALRAIIDIDQCEGP